MARKKQNDLRVGITVGDLNGVGMEIILKALSDPRIYTTCTPIVYGSAKAASFHKKTVKNGDVHFNIISKAEDLKLGKPNLVNIEESEIKITLGKPGLDTGKFAYRSIEAATKDLAEGLIDVMVTAPINKRSIADAGFKFPGHTEYLMNYSQAEESLMFMVSENMRIGVVSGHVPLAEVPKDISKEKIQSKVRIMHQSLQRDFGIEKPKIAVLGLNPHAGDEGVLGSEEKDMIKPAVQELTQEGLLVYGPYGADGFFGTGQQKEFDGILAMYHDQGLAPFKALAFDTGVNFTAGLPIVRTSPAHGTAYNIAGQDAANPQSLLSAIYTAADVHSTRQQQKEWYANPLKKQRTGRQEADN